MSDSCKYRELSSRFKDSLDLPVDMFNEKFDYCFCQTCHKRRGDNDHYTRGNPAKIYVLPKGWRRFGIAVTAPPETTEEHVWRDWHVAFHGTRVCSIESIWRVGLKMPGETMYNGKGIVELWGHYNDKAKPEGVDTKKIFVSPSIRYAGADEYAPSKSFEDPKTNTSYNCKVAFQLRIKPSSYNIGKKTIKQNSIDTYIKDNILEWSTKDKDSIMLTGLLVRMVESYP